VLLRSDQAFALLFTDLVLPGGMNGVEIAEEAIRLQPQIRFLFTSGYASKGIIRSAQSDFSEVLIKKPYRRADLLQKVRAVLDRAD
jgi:CheY-like chemotaxis protein